MHRRRVELCGVAVDVETDHEPFARYVDGQFPDRPSADGAPDIAVRVRWVEGGPPELTPATVFPRWPADVRVDRHVWMGRDAILCLRPDDAPQIAIASAPGTPRRFELRFRFALDGTGWRGIVRRALRWRRIPVMRRNRLSTLLYYAVYYPVWWHLEARERAHPLHAAGVALGGRALLLAGLPGCGKSTLATALLGDPGAELLSDNVVLHDGAQLFGCFEPLLLDATTRHHVAARVELRPVGRVHQFARDAYHAPHRTDGVPLAAALLVARGGSTRLERVPSTDCARMLVAVNEAAKELRRYHILAGLWSLIERDALGYAERRIADLDRLLAAVPCYWLQVRDGAPAEGVEALRDLVAGAREAVRS
ncbi:MAG TPA: hypothetical protein VKU61_06385 [Candidatus Binatia bacterium]|nr:hypothetical protein [Candidatus Binatia bacterium]